MSSSEQVPQCAVKLSIQACATIVVGHNVDTAPASEAKNHRTFRLQSGILVERVWLQGYVRRPVHPSAAFSLAPDDGTGSASSNTEPQSTPPTIDVMQGSSEKWKVVEGDYVMVIGKMRAAPKLKQQPSSWGEAGVGGGPSIRPAVTPHKVVLLPGDAEQWQQAWREELAHLHSLVYPR